MINAGIFDGDLVMCEEAQTARNAEMVVALIDDSATVKTYYKEAGYYRLQPENDTMAPNHRSGRRTPDYRKGHRIVPYVLGMVARIQSILVTLHKKDRF